MNKKPNFTFIDLFAGIGGFRLALQRLGGTCLHFSEINNDAIEAYTHNFNEDVSMNLGDIRAIKALPAHGLLTAGVPCQSWSIAGKNLGFNDDRGQLWNDTIYLLNQSRPKAFIFENVKGLADPRNSEALSYILRRIKDAGYFAKHWVLNASDYGVPQDRVRVYIVGFLCKEHLDQFVLPDSTEGRSELAEVLDSDVCKVGAHDGRGSRDLFGASIQKKSRSYTSQGVANDFFLFNDIRNGPTTIHSWDLLQTTERQKGICLLMLRNRRKSNYGELDGNPLALCHLQALDKTISLEELEALVAMGILKKVEYVFTVVSTGEGHDDSAEQLLLNLAQSGHIRLDQIKASRDVKLAKISVGKTLESLKAKKRIFCADSRYEFRYTKISTGIEGVNRIFLPRSKSFPTLVASDTNDYIALKNVDADNEEDYKQRFLNEIYEPQNFRKISKAEACLIQGFPADYVLPSNRSRWMKLVGNSVAVPVIEMLASAIIATGCFKESNVVDRDGSLENPRANRRDECLFFV